MSSPKSSPVIMIDIETVPSGRCRDYVGAQDVQPDQRYQSDQPPTTITNLKSDALREQRLEEWKRDKELKSEQDVAQKRQKLLENGGLKWWTGKVICISSSTPTGTLKTWCGDDEREILTGFFDFLVTECNGYMVGGKQSSDFDIPFLVGRAMALDLGVPDHLRTNYEIRDVNYIFGPSHMSGQRGKLDDYAFGLNIAGKLGHGSDVYGKYMLAITGDANQWNEIKRYCEQDVTISMEVAKRYSKPFKPSEVFTVDDIPF